LTEAVLLIYFTNYYFVLFLFSVILAILFNVEFLETLAVVALFYLILFSIELFSKTVFF
jgi:hypothetical protein